MPEPLFDRLYRETTKMNWQTTDAIIHRGQRRATRHRVAMAASVFVAVLLLGTTATVIAWRTAAAPVSPGTTTSANPTPTRSNGPSPDPTPALVTVVPADAMLQPADTAITAVDDHPRGGDWPVEWSLNYCPTRSPQLNLTPVSTRERAFNVNEERYVLQYVHAYAAGDAQRQLAWVRQAIVACPRFELSDPVSLTILAESFAGDDSILVEENTPNGRGLFVIVRVGNLLTEIKAAPADQSLSRTLGQRAADRLCTVVAGC